MHDSYAEDKSSVETKLVAENRDLLARLEAAEATLRAIHADEVDAIVIKPGDAEQVRTLRGDEAYRTLVEVMCQGAATVGADGSILYCNRHFLSLLQSSSVNSIGASIYQFVAPEQEGAFRALLWGALTASCTAKPFSLRRSDGRAISTMITATPLSVDGIACVSIVLTDLTQHEELLAAEAAHRMKDEFLTTLSHELRTPLSTILLWAKMLADGAVAERDQAGAFRAIIASAEVQRKLIDDLLDISRMNSGKLGLNPIEVRLAEAVQEAVAAAQPAADAKKILLHLDSQRASDPRILGDPCRLQQIFSNLLTNAIKFTPSGGEVRVKLELDATVAKVVVSDTGIGMTPEFLPLIFDRFTQADPSSARVHGGLGLGLSIVRQLVELQGGTVDAQCGGLGQGATFTLAFPLWITEAN